MEDTSAFTNQEGLWKEPELFSKMKKRYTVLGVIAFFLASACFPLCGNEWVAIGVLVALSAYVIWLVHTPLPAVGLLLTTVLITTLGSSFAAGAVFLSLAVGCMSGAFLLTSHRLPRWITLLIPVLSVGVAFAVTRDPILSLLALSLLPAAGLLAFATLRDCPRTSILCFCIGGFVLTLAVIVLILIWKTTGGINRTCVLTFVEGTRNSLIEYFLIQRDAALSLLAGQVTDASTQEAYNQIAATFTPDLVRSAVLEFFNLLPALVTVIFSIAAFFGQMLLLSAYHAAGVEKVLTVRVRTLTVSIVAAVLFIVSFVLTLILSDSMAYAVSQNLCLILLPLMFLTGFSALLAMTRSSTGARVFLLLMLGALFCCYSGGLLYLVALWGAYNRIAAEIQRKIQEKADQTPKDDGSD